MNCKPGEMAFYVGEDISMHGRIVCCVQLLIKDPAVWVTEPSLPLADGSPSVGIWDSALRPIRDPGEDAKDETLSWLPVPSVQKEAA